MASLYFYYSAMNAGKSTTLLQASYNYHERGMKTLILAPFVDNRFGEAKVASRIGIEAPAQSFMPDDNLYELVESKYRDEGLHCVLVDECQFLTRQQVSELSNVVDDYNIPVLAYGLRTDFQGEPFEGSQYLMAWADKMIELKSICHCGRKATMVIRVDSEGNPVKEGEQIEIGGNDKYISMCRRHFKEALFK